MAIKLSGHASPTTVYIVTTVFSAVACLSVLGRLYSRIRIVRNAGVDDAFITLGWAFGALMAISFCAQAEFGMGHHISDLSSTQFEKSLFWFWVSAWSYAFSIWFVKLSILTQYLQLFPHPRFRILCWVLIGLVTAWSMWAIFSAIFWCRPVSGFWKIQEQHKCINRMGLWYGNAGVNIVSDLVVTILPLPLLRGLKLPSRQKVLLMLVFSVGSLVCVVSVLRLVYIYPVSITTDVTWESPLVCITTAVETNVAIICSCAPTLKGLIQRIFPRLLESLSTKRLGAPNDTPLSREGLTRDSSYHTTKSSCGVSSKGFKCGSQRNSKRLSTGKPSLSAWSDACGLDSRSAISVGDTRTSFEGMIEVTREFDQRSSHHASEAGDEHDMNVEKVEVPDNLYDLDFKDIVRQD